MTAFTTYLDLQEFFQTDLVRFLSFFGCLALRLEHEAWWERVSVLAFLTAVWTLPEPSEPVRELVDIHWHDCFAYFSVSIASMKYLQTI